MKKSLIEECNEILGEDIFNHDLILGKPSLCLEIKQCKTMDNVVAILNREYKKKHGRFLSLPGGRYQYWKYIGENAKPLPPKKEPEKKKGKGKKPSIVREYLERQALKKKDDIIKRLLEAPEENFHY